MTGWQGGGWNPQQDPYGGGQGGQYGADPYGQPDPYGQYGADPYGQYGADPYGGGGYPGYQGGFGPPPPKRSKLPIVLSIVAILAIVGTVLTIVLLNRNEEDPAPTAGPGGSSAPSKPPSSPKGGPSSSRKVPSGTKKPPSGKDGWATFEFSGGTFQAPGDWKKDTAKRASGLGVDFAPGAVVGVYDCEGARYFRGFVATGEAQSRTGAELELNKTVAEFATAFAREYYRNPQLEVTAPKSTTVDGKQAATITIKLTITPTRPACEATGGEVALIGVPIEKDGKRAGVRMLVVVNDLAGGPSTPEGLPDALAEEIVGTLTLK